MKKIFYALTCGILVTVACGTSSIAPTLDANQLQAIIASTALAAKNQTETAIGPIRTPIPTNTNLPTNTPTVTKTTGPSPTSTFTITPIFTVPPARTSTPNPLSLGFNDLCKFVDKNNRLSPGQLPSLGQGGPVGPWRGIV